MKLKLTLTRYRAMAGVLLTALLCSTTAMAGVTVERQTTFTDDNGGRAVTIGQGEFERPGSEFTVSATFTDFQPDNDGPRINGQLGAVSTVSGVQGLFVRRASRTTVFNGEVNLSNLPRSEEDVLLEVVDLSITDEGQQRQGRNRNRNAGQDKWSGEVIINGERFTPEELPRPARELLRHLIGILRH